MKIKLFWKRYRDPKVKYTHIIFLLSIIQIIALIIFIAINILAQIKQTQYIDDAIKETTLASNQYKLKITGTYNFSYLPIIGIFFCLLSIGLQIFFISNKENDKEVLKYPFYGLIIFVVIAFCYILYKVVTETNGRFVGMKSISTENGDINKLSNYLDALVKQYKHLIIMKWAQVGIISIPLIISFTSMIFASKLYNLHNRKTILL